jgi:hypothetical protein
VPNVLVPKPPVAGIDGVVGKLPPGGVAGIEPEGNGVIPLGAGVVVVVGGTTNVPPGDGVVNVPPGAGVVVMVPGAKLGGRSAGAIVLKPGVRVGVGGIVGVARGTVPPGKAGITFTPGVVIVGDGTTGTTGVTGCTG